MTSRRSISSMRRLSIFERAAGVCSLCQQKIKVGERWDVEHRIPLALGGSDDESNMAPAHEACHDRKSKTDFADISRAKRRKIKHYGGTPKLRSFGTLRKPEGHHYDWRLRKYVRDTSLSPQQSKSDE